jgi:hypothetical protein
MWKGGAKFIVDVEDGAVIAKIMDGAANEFNEELSKL